MIFCVHQWADGCKFMHHHYKIVYVNKNLSAEIIATFSPWSFRPPYTWVRDWYINNK